MSSHFNFLFDGMSRVYAETITLKEPFISFASRFAHDLGTVILISSDDVDCGRYNILGCDPWLSFYGKHRRIKTVDTYRSTLFFNVSSSSPSFISKV